MNLFTLKVCGYAALSLTSTGCVIGGADDSQRPETYASRRCILPYTFSAWRITAVSLFNHLGGRPPARAKQFARATEPGLRTLRPLPEHT